ncbi:hypothetical protein [Conexibacter sp. JD483]|uniref:hypothetical protein n=1 Tax=Conexibacter sp. JD483 TaxID=3064471 RepID=UPI00286FF679|nr:hypothetical protein [Conexibacter sp. JD483]
MKGGLLLALITASTLGAIAMVEAYHRHVAGRSSVLLMVAGVLAVAVPVGYPAVGPLPAEDGTADAADVVDPSTSTATTRPSTTTASAPATTAPTATSTPAATPPLRTVFTQTEPDLWSIALAEDPGVPSETTGWRELLSRGGVEIYSSRLQFTLANRSDEPITVRDIRAVVVGATPPPTTAKASVYTQGDAPLAEFLAELPSATRGAVAKLHRFYANESPPWDLDDHTPFFDDNYIELAPHEIYEGTITLRARAPKLLSYRFVTTVSTATRTYTVEEPELHRLSGLSGDPANYAHGYLEGYAAWAKQSICPTIEVTRWSDAADNGRCPARDRTGITAETQFHSPGGRVACRVGPAAAVCTIFAIGRTFAVEDGIGSSYRGIAVAPGMGDEAAWGASFREGDFECRMPDEADPRGVICLNHATDHGFEASRVKKRRRVF